MNFEETDADGDGEQMPESPWANDQGAQQPSTWTDRLRNTHPSPPIEKVGSFGDIKDHWSSYGLRGIQKVAAVDDAEAWVDLLKFFMGGFMHLLGGGDPTAEIVPASEGEGGGGGDWNGG